MAILKKNIWTLFYMILFIGTVLLTTIIYNLNINTQKEYISKQENITSITSNSVSSILLQYEMILDILGNQLIDNNNYLSTKNSQMILDKLLKLNKSIGAFGLAKPTGQLYLTSSNLKLKKLPNLMKREETKKSFIQTLKSDKMVIGRTYYFKRIDSLIIPIRKAIRDKNGKVIAVMTAGINVNKGFEFFNKTDNEIVLFRDFDNFVQLINHNNTLNFNIYKKEVPSVFTDRVFFSIFEKYGTNLLSLKKSEKVVTVKYTSYNDNTLILSSIKYLKRYNLWIITKTPNRVISDDIYGKSFLLLVLYLLVNIIIFVLFKYIYEAEKSKKEALSYQATHDYLTKLHNRFFLSNEFSQLDKKNPFYLLFIDMDNFKSVNDNYGHDYGDLLLKEISKRLTNIKEAKDILVRYSGDEFIFISYINDRESIEKLAQSIISELSRVYYIKEYQFMLGSSIGVSKFPQDGNNFDNVKRYADLAMYEAKKERNSYRIFESSIKNKYHRISLIEQELRKAIPNNEIYMMYQPQVSQDGKIHGVEALVRWNNKTLGFVPPDEFISIAETTGSMLSLGRFIINTSLTEVYALQKELGIDFNLSINISVKQFMEIGFYEKLFDQINISSFNKCQITLEVTENIFIEDIEFILNLLNRLKAENIKISLDDFGTGFSSLSLLKKLPIDELKIDKTFVDDIADDKESLHMVQSIISIGKNLSMSVLAEGVETVEQKNILTQNGCDLFQGYLYSKPLKIDDLKTFIKNS